MKVTYRLKVKINSEYKVIEFGEPSTGEEKHEMFELRHEIYSQRNYFNKSYSAKELDIDAYDRLDSTKYFIAKLEGKIIGSVRRISGAKLPTELYFEFEEPREMKSVGPNERAEVSRLVVKRPSEKYYLPRNVVMLFMVKALVEQASKDRIKGGYMFLKLGVRQKLRRLKVPIHLIRGYSQTYPKTGIMAPYFFNPNDKVIPAYFKIQEISEFLKNTTDNRWIFKNEGNGNYLLKSNVYNIFLRALKII